MSKKFASVVPVSSSGLLPISNVFASLCVAVQAPAGLNRNTMVTAVNSWPPAFSQVPRPVVRSAGLPPVVTFVSVPPCANVTRDWKFDTGAPVWQSWALTCKIHAPWICFAWELDDFCPAACPAVATGPVVRAIVPASTENRARFRTERWIFESMFNPPCAGVTAFPAGPCACMASVPRAWQKRKRGKKRLIGFEVLAGGRIRSPGTSGVPHEDDVTGLLVAWGQGDRAADSRLIAVVYQDLRRVARRRLRAERADHSLAPTALVHEAYMRLVDLRRVRWQNRAQFFAIAARLMRQILVDHARAHVAAKRGGAGWKMPLADDLGATMPRDVDLLDLDVALDKLATIDSRLGDLVVLRFFGGMTVEEAAESLGLSPATVKRDWSRARAWLFRDLRRVVNERDSVRSRGPVNAG